MYHSVGDSGNGEVGAELYRVSVENFRKQMEYVATRKEDSPILTFDDGLADNYTHAWPILKAKGIKAYFFIIVSKIGLPGYMNWGQIKELKDAGMTIGSHGMTHKILSGLLDLDYELRISKKNLEDELKCPIDFFSIPRGYCNKTVIHFTKDAGYKSAFTSNPNDNDGFVMGRIAVKGCWGLDYFVKVLNNGLSLKDKTEECIKNASKKILGIRNYDRLRSRILEK